MLNKDDYETIYTVVRLLNGVTETRSSEGKDWEAFRLDQLCKACNLLTCILLEKRSRIS